MPRPGAEEDVFPGQQITLRTRAPQGDVRGWGNRARRKGAKVSQQSHPQWAAVCPRRTT